MSDPAKVKTTVKRLKNGRITVTVRLQNIESTEVTAASGAMQGMYGFPLIRDIGHSIYRGVIESFIDDRKKTSK